MAPPDGAKRKLDGLIDSVMNNGMKMTENFADSDDGDILLNWEGVIKWGGVKNYKKCYMTP